MEKIFYFFKTIPFREKWIVFPGPVWYNISTLAKRGEAFRHERIAARRAEDRGPPAPPNPARSGQGERSVSGFPWGGFAIYS